MTLEARMESCRQKVLRGIEPRVATARRRRNEWWVRRVSSARSSATASPPTASTSTRAISDLANLIDATLEPGSPNQNHSRNETATRSVAVPADPPAGSPFRVRRLHMSRATARPSRRHSPRSTRPVRSAMSRPATSIPRDGPKYDNPAGGLGTNPRLAWTLTASDCHGRSTGLTVVHLSHRDWKRSTTGPRATSACRAPRSRHRRNTELRLGSDRPANPGRRPRRDSCDSCCAPFRRGPAAARRAELVAPANDLQSPPNLLPMTEANGGHSRSREVNLSVGGTPCGWLSTR